jgi:anti-anti-sigma factor
MTIKIREVRAVTILDVDGRLSQRDTVRELEAQAKQLLGERKLKLLVNLGKVSHVDSSGVGTLVRCYTSAKAAGGDLKIVRPNKAIRRILDTTNLAQILGRVFDDEQEAIARLE